VKRTRNAPLRRPVIQAVWARTESTRASDVSDTSKASATFAKFTGADGVTVNGREAPTVSTESPLTAKVTAVAAESPPVSLSRPQFATATARSSAPTTPGRERRDRPAMIGGWEGDIGVGTIVGSGDGRTSAVTRAAREFRSAQRVREVEYRQDLAASHPRASW
jgi:hypothetical protein